MIQMHQGARQLQSGKSRHLNIQKEEIRLQVFRQLERSRPVRSFANDLHALALQQEPEILAGQRFVIYDQDSHRRSLFPNFEAPWRIGMAKRASVPASSRLKIRSRARRPYKSVRC